MDRLWHLLSRHSSYPITQTLFLRLLGLIYLSAFGSLWPQIRGLIGSHGIVPAVSTLNVIRSEFSVAHGVLVAPSLFWFGINDAVLVWCCILGCLSALLMIVSNLWARAAAILCWVLYLSFVSIGSPFLTFQWDALLLEAGFLGLFAGAPWLVWAYRLLLFRLVFQSGAIKFLSGDVNWRNLHALRYHFLTQPLPSPLAYYAYRLPSGLLDGLTGLVLGIELIAPFLLFCPRRVRRVGVALLMLLQVGILITGNYAFFNLLSLALCLWGLDDRTFAPLQRLLSSRKPFRAVGVRNIAVLRLSANLLLLVYLLLSAAQLLLMFRVNPSRPLRVALDAVAPFEIVNSYGLFAVMTTERPEIVVQGSNDQEHWVDYSFQYKPGELHRNLPLIAPYQPRLDWQMWFAALGSYTENPWVSSLMYRILVGDPTVLKLMDRAPFAKPPRYLRAMTYSYDFTTPAERSRTGAVWKRKLQGPWFGPVSLTGR